MAKEITEPTAASGLLADVLKKYAVPDPSIVSKLPKGGTTLDFVGHADITRILIEVDPMWNWEPVALDEDGLPKYRVENGMAHMAGRLTIHGVSRLGIGSAPHNKQDLLKELVSDFLRNASMRFGIALNLWTKNEWEDLGGRPAPGRGKPAPAKPAQAPAAQAVTNVVNLPTEESSRAKHPANKPTKQQVDFIVKAATVYGDPVVVCSEVLGKPVQAVEGLTVDELKQVNEALKARKAD